jgi:hypothetical protein
MVNSMDFWEMNNDDWDLLRNLQDSIYSLTSLAKSGAHLIAIGEVIEAIESLLNEDQIDINVGLDIGFRRGDRDFEEGLFVCLRINSEEIILNELNTTYSSDIGSDSYTVDYVHLVPGSHLNHIDLTRWLEKLSEIQSFDDAKLTVSRDHI